MIIVIYYKFQNDPLVVCNYVIHYTFREVYYTHTEQSITDVEQLITHL